MGVIDLSDTTEVRAIWFVSDRETMDWMACVLLHLWRPVKRELPTPPSILVGPQ